MAHTGTTSIEGPLLLWCHAAGVGNPLALYEASWARVYPLYRGTFGFVRCCCSVRTWRELTRQSMLDNGVIVRAAVVHSPHSINKNPDMWRRSTIEVHPKFSEAPYFGSSIPHTITDLTKISNRIPMNNPMAQEYKYPGMPFFETGLAFRRCWVEEPRCSEHIPTEMCYLYRRTRL